MNVGAVVEYKEVSERYQFLKGQIEDVEKSKEELLKLIGELTKQMREQFVERFGEINRNFGTIFRELFGGGAAELSFTDESDVSIPALKSRCILPARSSPILNPCQAGKGAGSHFHLLCHHAGQSAAASVCWMRLRLPWMMNVARYAQYLRRMSGNSQFITITHRRGTMEGSDMLYGVTMQDQGISKLLALKTEEAVEQLG